MHPVPVSLYCFVGIVGTMILAKLTNWWRAPWGVVFLISLVPAFGVLFTWLLFRGFVSFD